MDVPRVAILGIFALDLTIVVGVVVIRVVAVIEGVDVEVAVSDIFEFLLASLVTIGVLATGVNKNEPGTP